MHPVPMDHLGLRVEVLHDAVDVLGDVGLLGP